MQPARPANGHQRVGVFFAGVQKGGTTTLHAHMAAHPQLCAPNRKEPHVFDDETLPWAPGSGRLADYNVLHRHYPAADWPAADGRLCYDATPIHSFWPPALARIRAYNPQARLIWIFRDPLERAWSHWRMEYDRGAETLPFAQAIRAEAERLAAAGPLSPAARAWSYGARGRYGQQVARALTLFPRGQMLMLTTQQLQHDLPGTLARLAAFLGVAPFGAVAPLRENAASSAHHAPPTAADAAYLWAQWRDDLAMFEALSGVAIAAWAKTPANA